MAVIVIGDIHGAFRALEQLIARVQPCKGDRLVFLGDYVDGWSQSAQVIGYLLQLSEQYDCLFIKGNHDAWCGAWLAGAPADSNWLTQGGQATVNSYNGIPFAERLRHLVFFERLRNYYVDEQNRLFVHAGFSSIHGPAREHYETNYYWDRTLWEMVVAMDRRIRKDSKLYPKRLLLFEEIFVGHTPTLNYGEEEPMYACNVWNMDTGAAYYGRLSAMNIDTRQIWQSDPVPVLYPGEKGRNK